MNESSFKLDLPLTLPSPVDRGNTTKRVSSPTLSSDSKKARTFLDDDSIFIELDVNHRTPNRTQRMLSKIDSSNVLYSQQTGAHYAKKQRTMVNLNEENILNDDVSISQFNSQFRKELEGVFSECENSILAKGLDLSLQPENVLNGISRIDWDETLQVPPKIPISQTSHGKVQLAPVSSATFHEMGPFFGLPMKVKALIHEFKGIEDLYGKFPSNYCMSTIINNLFRLAKGMPPTKKCASKRKSNLCPSNKRWENPGG